MLKSVRILLEYFWFSDLTVAQADVCMLGEKGVVFKSIKKWKKRENMLRLMLQSSLYYKKLFLNSNSVACKQEPFQIKSGL